MKGEVGSRSNKKLACTKGRNSRAHENDHDYRARWKTKQVQVGQYTNTQLTWSDIIAAQTLCDRGIAMYKVQANVGITDEWLAMKITQGITATFGTGIGVILAKALLWPCFDPSTCNMVSLIFAMIGLHSLYPIGDRP